MNVYNRWKGISCMTINQMGAGSSVTLTVNIKREAVTLETRVAQGYPDEYRNTFCVGLEPIFQDGTLVSLGKHQISATIINSSDHREYQYTISYHGLNKDRSQLLLFSADDIPPVNHRLNYRVPCSYHIVVQIGNNKKAVEGYMHDISLSGIGMVFVTGEFKSIQVGDAVSASIFDNYEHVYKVSGHVIRTIDDFAENRILVGAQFEETPHAIVGLVAGLQRRELRLRKKVEEKKKRFSNHASDDES